MAGLLLFTVIISSIVQINSKQDLNVMEYHSYMYEEINKWFSEFEWIRVGKNFCFCEKYKSQSFCDDLRKKNQIQCLEGPKGSKLLVKNFGLEAEIQAKYDPTPSRGISFIR